MSKQIYEVLSMGITTEYSRARLSLDIEHIKKLLSKKACVDSPLGRITSCETLLVGEYELSVDSGERFQITRL